MFFSPVWKPENIKCHHFFFSLSLSGAVSQPGSINQSVNRSALVQTHTHTHTHVIIIMSTGITVSTAVCLPLSCKLMVLPHWFTMTRTDSTFIWMEEVNWFRAAVGQVTDGFMTSCPDKCPGHRPRLQINTALEEREIFNENEKNVQVFMTSGQIWSVVV